MSTPDSERFASRCLAGDDGICHGGARVVSRVVAREASERERSDLEQWAAIESLAKSYSVLSSEMPRTRRLVGNILALQFCVLFFLLLDVTLRLW